MPKFECSKYQISLVLILVAFLASIANYGSIVLHTIIYLIKFAINIEQRKVCIEITKITGGYNQHKLFIFILINIM